MKTIGDSFLRPKQNCSNCHGTGTVNDRVPYGNGMVDMPSGCDCAYSNQVLTGVMLRVYCRSCGSTDIYLFPGPERPLTCKNCNYKIHSSTIMPLALANALQTVVNFIDGEYDDMTENALVDLAAEAICP